MLQRRTFYSWLVVMSHLQNKRRVGFPDRILPDMAEEANHPSCRKLQNHGPVPEASISLQTDVTYSRIKIYIFLRILVLNHESGTQKKHEAKRYGDCSDISQIAEN